MAEKKSELGKKINAVKGTIKQKIYPIQSGKFKQKNFSNL